jgi:hypothetical protein
MLYFGYGSNLCAPDLDRYCRERGLQPLSLRRIGPAFLPDRRLAFTHRSTSRGGGVLDVPPARGEVVAGVLFEVSSDASIATLDRKEGEGHVYRRFDSVVLTDDGAETPAVSYEVPPTSRESYVAPSPSYLDVVRRGYEDHGLDLAPLPAPSLASSFTARFGAVRSATPRCCVTPLWVAKRRRPPARSSISAPIQGSSSTTRAPR